jgi:hypothetical protein
MSFVVIPMGASVGNSYVRKVFVGHSLLLLAGIPRVWMGPKRVTAQSGRCLLPFTYQGSPCGSQDVPGEYRQSRCRRSDFDGCRAEVAAPMTKPALARPAFWGSLFFAVPVIGIAWQLVARGPLGRMYPALASVVSASNASNGV